MRCVFKSHTWFGSVSQLQAVYLLCVCALYRVIESYRVLLCKSAASFSRIIVVLLGGVVLPTSNSKWLRTTQFKGGVTDSVSESITSTIRQCIVDKWTHR